MRFHVTGFLLLLACLALPRAAAGWADPESTVRVSGEILRESLAMSGKRIPESLLADAHGVAIIPDVIKIGFVAAVRRGHGVVMVRDAGGAWTLPQFVTLTGGSVGWQAGIQGTDVILVFMTKKSVEGLLNGKFTIGADASAAAGPVGRNAAAATDTRLKAEILSYSRSRGLFAGISLDGTAIEMDRTAASAYYGVPAGQPPQRVPESAMRLLQELTQSTEPARAGPPADAALAPAGPTPATATVRQQLAASAQQLFAVVDDGWRKYLALPKEVFAAGNPPRLDALQAALGQYDRVVQAPKYEALVGRAEFQSTYGLLREYVDELSRPSGPTATLPPPPSGR